MHDPTAPPVRLVIVGHVDHGKSTLIGRLLLASDSLPAAVAARVAGAGVTAPAELLAFIADGLREEREQERTIDTTQLFFDRGGRHYVITDTPGHAEFIRHMFTGASRAEAALVVIAATESIRPQTRAHCHVLALLGIRFVQPLVNKMDAAGCDRDRFAAVAAQADATLRSLGLHPRPALPISALTGENIAERSPRLAWFDGPTLMDVLGEIPAAESPADQPFRFAVQDVYDVQGKSVVVGRVEAGRISVGDRVAVLPGRDRATVATIEVFGGAPASAEAGQSIGLTLDGVAPPGRGRILADPAASPAVADALVGQLFWMDDRRPLTPDQTLAVRIATQEVSGRVQTIAARFAPNRDEPPTEAADRLSYGQIARVRIVTSAPLARDPYTRATALGTFVLARDGNLVAAGTVVE